MGGEGLAVDLADTLVTVSTPPLDLLAGDGASQRFWDLHGVLLPTGWAPPPAATTRRLRAVVRALLDAAQQGAPLARKDVEMLNTYAQEACRNVVLSLRDGRAERVERWHAGDPAALAIAAVAHSAIEILTAARGDVTVRRCASASCSMLFVTGDARRRWCTPNICANRDRAARHYRRRLGAPNA